jgi:hypothetical protein
LVLVPERIVRVSREEYDLDIQVDVKVQLAISALPLSETSRRDREKAGVEAGRMLGG